MVSEQLKEIEHLEIENPETRVDHDHEHEPEVLEGEKVGIEDEKYLSAATLARLKELTFKGEKEGKEEAKPVVETVETVQAEELGELAEEPSESVEEPIAESVVLVEHEGEGGGQEKEEGARVFSAPGTVASKPIEQ